MATPLNILWSAELSEAKTTVAVEERHPTRPDSTMTSSVFSIEKLQNMPGGRQYQAVFVQAAGVIGAANRLFLENCGLLGREAEGLGEVVVSGGRFGHDLGSSGELIVLGMNLRAYDAGKQTWNING